MKYIYILYYINCPVPHSFRTIKTFHEKYLFLSTLQSPAEHWNRIKRPTRITRAIPIEFRNSDAINSLKLLGLQG